MNTNPRYGASCCFEKSEKCESGEVISAPHVNARFGKERVGATNIDESSLRRVFNILLHTRNYTV